MTKHANKLGHALSKALAGRNRNSDALRSILTAAEQFDLVLVSDKEQSEELIGLPLTPFDEDLAPDPESKPAKPGKQRVVVGANGWEGGFKLIRGSYWIRIQRRGTRRCINLKTNSIRLARERREELSTLLVETAKFGEKVPIMVDQLWQRYSAVAGTRIKQSTLDGYRRLWERDVLPLIGEMFAIDVTNEVVDQLLAEFLGLSLDNPRPGKGRPVRKKTKPAPEEDEEGEINLERGNRLIQALKVVFYWGLESKLLDFMPFTNSKVPVQEMVRPYIGIREIPRYVEAAMEHSEDPEARELQCLMGIFLGLRPKEIRLAKKENIDFEKQTFFPSRTKTKSTRQVFIPSFLKEKLNAYLESRNLKAGDYLFTRPGTKTPVGTNFLRIAVQKAGQAIGKPKLTPHRQRNTFATLHAVAGTPIRVIQSMLGHKCIQTTLLYIQDVPELAQIAQARLEALVGYGTMGGVGVASLQPWHQDIGAIMGNLSPLFDKEPMLAPGTLIEIMNSLKAKLQQVETALSQSLQGLQP